MYYLVKFNFFKKFMKKFYLLLILKTLYHSMDLTLNHYLKLKGFKCI